MAQKIFVDTTAFVDLITKSKNWQRIGNFFESSENDLYTSVIVLDELKFQFLYIAASQALNSDRKFEIIAHIKTNPKFTSLVYRKYLAFYYYIESKFGIFEYTKRDEDLSNSLAIRYLMLPKDAAILATMINGKISRIFTSDADFKKIKEIKVIEP